MNTRKNIDNENVEAKSQILSISGRSKKVNCDTLSALAQQENNCQAKLVELKIDRAEAHNLEEAVMAEQVIGGQIVSAITTTIGAPADVDQDKFLPLVMKLAMSGARAQGFWSGDLEAPVHAGDEWVLIQRFKQEKDAVAFAQSDARKQVLSELKGLAAAKPVEVTETSSMDKRADITSGIITEIKEGMEAAYFDWEYKVQVVQAKQPGYRGTYFQPPSASKPRQWATMLHFDKPESMERWFTSDERKALLEEQVNFVNSTQIKSLQSSFPGWFPVDNAGDPPAVYKTALLVLLGLFPTVMLEIKFLAPLLSGLNPAVGNFLSLVLSVIVTTYLTTPVFIQWFTWWLVPQDKSQKLQIDIKGNAILAGLFLAEIALMWNLLLK